jgi:hypothetical protein
LHFTRVKKSDEQKSEGGSHTPTFFKIHQNFFYFRSNMAQKIPFFDSSQKSQKVSKIREFVKTAFYGQTT